jgi:copper(I)-binding protein
MMGRVAIMLTLLLPAMVDAGRLQPTVRVTDGWVQTEPGNEAKAFITVTNGTMYDVYLVGASSDAATTVELKQMADGKPVPAKDVAIPSFDRLQMSPKNIFVSLVGLKRTLKTGESVTIVLTTDAGEQLSAAATVK